MIEKLVLQDVPSFSGSAQSMDTLKRLNYIYGANGTGKTTVSNIIKNLDGFNNCSITWKDNISLNTFVYNKKLGHD